MPVGCTLPDPESDLSYEQFREIFEWDQPEQYNIATASLNHSDIGRSDTALYHVDEAGMHHEIGYKTLSYASDRLAIALAKRGIMRGTHVALCFPQSPELLVAHLACYKLEAVTVPVSVLLGDDSISYTLSHSEADFLLIDEEIATEFDDTSLAAADTVVKVRLNSSQYSDESGLGGFSTFVRDQLDKINSDPTAPLPSSRPDDPALLLYTSGTSGTSKGVLHGHRYLIGSFPGYLLWFHLLKPTTWQAQRVWSPSEWAWAGALFNVVFPTLAVGGTVVSRERRSGFNPEAALKFVDETRVTRAFMPPTALSLLQKAASDPDTSLPTLEIVQCGGEQLSPALSEWAQERFNLVVNEAYGQTEANALVGNCQELFEWRPGSMGRPYPGHDIRVVDENNDPVPSGELGELAIDGPDPVFFLEYWNDPEATSKKLTDDGLLKTGDMVTVDEDGYVWFRGRMDDLIISSGYRVSPVEVEEALEAHPFVSKAVVGGVPDDERGKRIKAYVLPKADQEIDDLDADTLRTLVRDRIGAHKTPDEIEKLIDVPQTRSGKIDRLSLFPDEQDES